MSTSDVPVIVEPTDASPQQSLELAAPDESMVQPGIRIGDLELPPPLEGKLTTLRLVERGGYGEVHQGIWSHGDKDVQVAIKCLTPRNRGSDNQASQERFGTRIRRETVIWQRAKHENILPFIGYQIVDGVSMLVSPWCQNRCLDIYIYKHPNITDWEKLELLCDAAQGLAHLHSLQPPVVHGDIKPDNILVTDDIRGALVDFGISRLMVGLGMRTGLTTAGGAGGTAGYQASELILNDKARATDKSDVYSFGGLILATMSGQSPFHQINTEAGIVLAVARGQTPMPKDHPELAPDDSLWDLIRRCWKSEPNQRPSMEEITDELKVEIRRRAPSGNGST